MSTIKGTFIKKTEIHMKRAAPLKKSFTKMPAWYNNYREAMLNGSTRTKSYDKESQGSPDHTNILADHDMTQIEKLLHRHSWTPMR